jgi:hypothetical protein
MKDEAASSFYARKNHATLPSPCFAADEYWRVSRAGNFVHFRPLQNDKFSRGF